MAGDAAPGRGVVLETSRLVLRPWRVAEAVVQHALWTERDPRLPPQRRIDADGRPTVADLEESIRTGRRPSSLGLLAVELLRRVWRQGYATEASLAVLDWAGSSGYQRVWATVWDWNTASRRVLAKVGFAETGQKEVDAAYGTTIFMSIQL